MGVIRECGGKMHMAQREWEKARNDFFEAFKNYDEAGGQRRVQCLKYLVLASMLTNSDINPFDSQEAKPYKNDVEVVAMTNLVDAYNRNEIRTFEKLLKQNSRSVMGDAFIRAYIEDLLKNIRTQVLLKVVAVWFCTTCFASVNTDSCMCHLYMLPLSSHVSRSGHHTIYPHINSVHCFRAQHH